MKRVVYIKLGIYVFMFDRI